MDIKLDEQKKKLIYKLTSSIVLDLSVDNDACGQFNVGGNMTRKAEESYPTDQKEKDLENLHLERIGMLIENLESNMRSSIDQICI